jgi:hypothetical protein
VWSCGKVVLYFSKHGGKSSAAFCFFHRAAASTALPDPPQPTKKPEFPKRLIDGTDMSGVTEAVRWRGGGGFRYYHLAPSLMEKDKWGNWVINPQYNAAMLSDVSTHLIPHFFEHTPVC